MSHPLQLSHKPNLPYSTPSRTETSPPTTQAQNVDFSTTGDDENSPISTSPFPGGKLSTGTHSMHAQAERREVNPQANVSLCDKKDREEQEEGESPFSNLLIGNRSTDNHSSPADLEGSEGFQSEKEKEAEGKDVKETVVGREGDRTSFHGVCRSMSECWITQRE